MNKALVGMWFMVAVFLAAIAMTQFLYDATKIQMPHGSAQGISPDAVRIIDLGFHSTVGSFLWVATMPEILDLFRNRHEYLGDVAYLNTIAPKLSYPYAFSVLTLPAIPTSTGYVTGLADSFVVGSRGLAKSDPDWRIPYYMALNYYLGMHDVKTAAIYFNQAAQTPGVPYYAKRFAENFGVNQRDRDRVKQLWATIRDTTNDPGTKLRAQAHIDHLDILDYLDGAIALYKKAFGTTPSTTGQLIARHIIPQVPQDPFGFTFIINGQGRGGVDVTN